MFILNCFVFSYSMLLSFCYSTVLCLQLYTVNVVSVFIAIHGQLLCLYDLYCCVCNGYTVACCYEFNVLFWTTISKETAVKRKRKPARFQTLQVLTVDDVVWLRCANSPAIRKNELCLLLLQPTYLLDWHGNVWKKTIYDDLYKAVLLRFTQ